MTCRGQNPNLKFKDWWGEFKYKNEQIINVKTGQAVEATSSSNVEGSVVYVNGNNGQVQQKWKIVYVD